MQEVAKPVASVAAFNAQFAGEAQSGEYHTCFDTFDHFTRYGDPGFVYGVALAQYCGRLTLRLTDAAGPHRRPVARIAATLRCARLGTGY